MEGEYFDRLTTPRMRLRKRLRVLLAALTQDWREETCPTCGDTWFSVTRATPSGLWCQSCESKQFEKWKREEYDPKHTKGVTQ